MNVTRSISAAVFVASLAILASCRVTSDDPRDDPETEASTQRASPPATQVAGPDDLQLITPDITCKTKHGVCIALRLCNEENDHVPFPASGCKTGTICCIPE